MFFFVLGCSFARWESRSKEDRERRLRVTLGEAAAFRPRSWVTRWRRWPRARRCSSGTLVSPAAGSERIQTLETPAESRFIPPYHLLEITRINRGRDNSCKKRKAASRTKRSNKSNQRGAIKHRHKVAGLFEKVCAYVRDFATATVLKNVELFYESL